jgi:hypothetical protein
MPRLVIDNGGKKEMITKQGTGIAQKWYCAKYGVTMSAAYADAFCARRFEAANDKDAARISFSRCHMCSRGATAYKIAKRKGKNMPDMIKSSSRR